jgi:FkbM family methyltransferase
VFNIALGNENKEVDFLSVDKEKYNNLGVGSLFEINFHNREKSDPDFNRESVQKKVQVELKKYSSLKLETPDLIAMDVQGAELDVLKGFENLLKKVKFIISESSISENYIGGSTFLEMHKYLKNNFKLLINSRYGKNNFKLNVDAYKYKLSEKKCISQILMFYI